MDELDEEEAVREAWRAQHAAGIARERAGMSVWDLNVVVFLFAILATIIILLFEGVPVEIVGPIAFFGLAMCWVAGWRQGKQLYRRFYHEELSTLKQGQEWISGGETREWR